MSKTAIGKPVPGIERSTFLIDEQGVRSQAWREAKVKGHAEQVPQALKAMRRGANP